RPVGVPPAGPGIGLSAGPQARLLGSAFYAPGDPRPPLRAALVRVAITAALGWAFALPLRDRLGYSPAWGAFGLTASAGAAAWIEFELLRRWLARRIGPVPVPVRLGLGTLVAAAAAGALGYLAGELASTARAPVWLGLRAAPRRARPPRPFAPRRHPPRGCPGGRGVPAAPAPPALPRPPRPGRCDPLPAARRGS